MQSAAHLAVETSCNLSMPSSNDYLRVGEGDTRAKTSRSSTASSFLTGLLGSLANESTMPSTSSKGRGVPLTISSDSLRRIKGAESTR